MQHLNQSPKKGTQSLENKFVNKGQPKFCPGLPPAPRGATTASWCPSQAFTRDLCLGLFSPPDDRNFLRLQSDGRREGQYARLISPPVHLPRSPVCMEFQYQATGGRGVALQVVREASQESKLLWVIREDQGGEWKHGRIILPSYDMEYQVGWRRETVRRSEGILEICVSIFQRPCPFIIRERG